MQKDKAFLKVNFRYSLLLFFISALFFLSFPLANSFGRDVSFNWTANSDNPPVDGYRLYYKIGIPGITLNDYNGSNAVNGNPSPVQIPGQGTTSYTLRNLLDSERYSFVLTAYRSVTESPPTSAISLNPITTVGNLTARINTNTLRGESPLPVSFDATTSTGNIVRYAWLFGDGNSGSGSVTSHTFSSAGNYTVLLRITDSSGTTAQTTVSITVTNPTATNTPPSAAISSSSSAGTPPLTVSLDGSASTDSDGTIVSYEWVFGDGGRARGARVNHTFRTAGTFNVMLTVTDNGGLTDKITTPVLLSVPSDTGNALPTAVITASPSKGYVPLTVTFNAGKSYDKDGNIETYNWSFGDGTVSSGVNVTHKFLQNAVYKVTLKVKDDKGANSFPVTFTVTVVDKSHPFSILKYLLLKQSSDEATVEKK